MVVMFLFLVPPMGYGWGYRRWGPPYPRYVQRRRSAAAAAGGPGTFDHHAWGWVGDLLWVMLLLGMACALWALWWT